MDSAPSDSLPKLDTSSTNSVPPSVPGKESASNANYYRPARSQPAAEPTAVSPISGTASVSPPTSSIAPQTLGSVPLAPGSTTLGSMPPVRSSLEENSVRPNLPTMGTSSAASDNFFQPASAPLEVSSAVPGAVVPPTVSTEASAHEAQQRMQAAHPATGNGGKKRSLLFPILGIVAVLAIAAVAAFYFWQQQNTVDSLPTVPDITAENTVEEDFIADNTDFEPAVALTQEELAIAQKSEVNGLLCSYDDQYEAGKINFYQPLTGVSYEYQVPAGAQEFTEMVPVGSYVAIFIPTKEDLPKLAYTEFIDCGMNYDTCTDHSLGQFVIAPDSTYEGVVFCDAQYEEEGLPAFLKQNENMREVL